MGNMENGVSSVGYAVSNNGISWEKNNEPVILNGETGEWDEGTVIPGPVLKENGTYKIYYSCSVEAHQPWQIGLAAATDGVSWTKYPDPVITEAYGITV